MQSKANNPVEIATFAGGCFWCTEAIFKRLKGVISVTSGYAGGHAINPTWQEVSTGATGHAEAIQITFDPKVIPYERLLDVFWHMHNPTTLNQQGNDKGAEYRSAIFYHDNQQKNIAEKSKDALEKIGIYKGPIVTEITPFTTFYPAEAYHKNFYESGNRPDYCTFVIDPKIQKLLKEYGNDVKEEYL
ncbi:MAG TPA: peptide-methionine (S)-S-oxide reductase MsrA [Candidatus Saccharimonadales bacterium]|nr:peptide-methionine (S)-S-oxide reductase MsrA [Candidatus Saccharimonadales bacterium]